MHILAHDVSRPRAGRYTVTLKRETAENSQNKADLSKSTSCFEDAPQRNSVPVPAVYGTHYTSTSKNDRTSLNDMILMNFDAANEAARPNSSRGDAPNRAAHYHNSNNAPRDMHREHGAADSAARASLQADSESGTIHFSRLDGKVANSDSVTTPRVAQPDRTDRASVNEASKSAVAGQSEHTHGNRQGTSSADRHNNNTTNSLQDSTVSAISRMSGPSVCDVETDESFHSQHSARGQAGGRDSASMPRNSLDVRSSLTNHDMNLGTRAHEASAAHAQARDDLAKARSIAEHSVSSANMPRQSLSSRETQNQNQGSSPHNSNGNTEYSTPHRASFPDLSKGSVTSRDATELSGPSPPDKRSLESQRDFATCRESTDYSGAGQTGASRHSEGSTRRELTPYESKIKRHMLVACVDMDPCGDLIMCADSAWHSDVDQVCVSTVDFH
jgi:hypothetical protein